jgi:hypothetical protein
MATKQSMKNKTHSSDISDISNGRILRSNIDKNISKETYKINKNIGKYVAIKILKLKIVLVMVSLANCSRPIF